MISLTLFVHLAQSCSLFFWICNVIIIEIQPDVAQTFLERGQDEMGLVKIIEMMVSNFMNLAG